MWIFLALFSRLLWSGCNAVDQIITRIHPAHKTQAALGLQQCLELPMGVAALLIAAFGHHNMPGPHAIAWIAIGVVMQGAALLPYYRCLEKEESYNIVPYMELTPVFVTIMAFVLRGEQLAPPQLVGAMMVILCGFLFSWDFSRGHFRRGVFVLMAVCSFFFAATQISLRMAEAGGDSAWAVTGTFLIGQGLTGFILLGARPAVRRVVVDTLVQTRGRSVLLGLFSNALSLVGLTTLLIAFTEAPTTGHASGLSGAQPFFSFFLAVILGRAFPAHFEKVGFSRETKGKLLLLFGILAGVWLLARG